MNQQLSFRDVQLGAVEVLKKLAALCGEQGWTYFLTYGSMLGAVRHQGVIPWDDDIDIMMPRPDYNKLRAYFTENSEALLPLKLFDHTTAGNYPHMIARISDQRYHLVFENEQDYGIGLFVDIYPLDGVGCDYAQAVKLVQRNKRTASLCFLTGRKSFGTDNTSSPWKMLLKLPAYLWANCFGNRHYIRKLEQAATRFSYEESNYVACAAWPAGPRHGQQRDVFPKEVFEEIIQVPFEDTTMCIPKNYDTFLRTTYGKYMAPPPEDKRTTNHTYHAYRV
ncbi:MAG: LicD family protein [Oscillospiraceae bacterium]|nr:LicD family protein [Oscillospiraceae bacterium]